MEQRRKAVALQATNYAKNPDTDAIALDELEQHMREEPEWEPVSPMMPVDEIEERMEIIKKLEAYWKRSFTRLTTKPQAEYVPFDNFQLSTLMWLDMTRLRRVVNEDTMAEGMLNAIFKMQALLKTCE